MGTKNNPGQFDCYANAEPDEPLFTLLARDPAAPDAILEWIRTRREMIALGEKPGSDWPVIDEALVLVDEMRAWRRKNREETS